jgi:hypothetical protein
LPKPWADVERNPEYQSLSDDDKEAARSQYFDEVVAPQVDTPDLEMARSQFDDDTKPTVLKKAGHAAVTAGIAAKNILDTAAAGLEQAITGDIKETAPILEKSSEALAKRGVASTPEVISDVKDIASSQPTHFNAAIARTRQNFFGVPLEDSDEPSKIIAESDRVSKEAAAKGGDKSMVLPGISRKDVQESGQNLSFSAASGLAGLGVGIPIGLVNPIAGWTGGTVTSGVVAGMQDANMFTRQIRDVWKEEFTKENGRAPTEQEWAEKRDAVGNLVLKHAAWEAIPEALGNLAGLKIIVKPLTKILGKNTVARVLGKTAGVYGTELVTETTTQTGQTNAEIEAGVSDAAPRSQFSPSDQWQSLKEVAPQVFLLTTMIAGPTAIASKAYDKAIVKPQDEAFSKIIKDATSSGQLDLIPEADLQTVVKRAEEVYERRFKDDLLGTAVNALKQEQVRRQTGVAPDTGDINAADVLGTAPGPLTRAATVSQQGLRALPAPTMVVTPEGVASTESQSQSETARMASMWLTPDVQSVVKKQTARDEAAQAERTKKSVPDIHALASSKNIPWDNDPNFMAFTEEVTGKRHLDDLNPADLKVLYDALAKRPVVKLAPVKRKQTLRDAVVNMGGINPDERMDTTGDDRGNYSIPGVGYLFTPKGDSLDGMAEKLVEAGWFSEADRQSGDATRKLSEMLKDEQSGIKQYYHPSDINAKMQSEYDKYYADQEERPEADPFVDLSSGELELSGFNKADEPTKDLTALYAVGRRKMGSDAFDYMLERLASQNENIDDNAFEALVRKEVENHGKDQGKAAAKSASRGGHLQTAGEVVGSAQGEEGKGTVAAPVTEKPKREPAAGAGTETPSKEGVAVSVAGKTADMFGGKNDTAQSVSDRETERKKKMAEAPPVESGEGDLFSGRAKQVDVEDVTGKSKQDQSSDLDEAAHEAATSPQNDLPEPTEAMKDAGNYKKGKIAISGLEISIENPEGSKRKAQWKKLKSHYGYIARVSGETAPRGKDKDHIDIFVKPGTSEDYTGPVFVIDQTNKDGAFDEGKVMLGWPDEVSASEGYLENYTKGWTGLGAIKQFTLEEFKGWLESGNTKKPVALETKSEQRAAAPVSADDRIRKIIGLNKEKLNEYDPKNAVSKARNHWSYTTTDGNHGQQLFDTKHEAISAAERHKALKLDQFDKPSEYFNLTSLLAGERVKLIDKYMAAGMTEMEAGKKAREEIPEQVEEQAPAPEAGEGEAATTKAGGTPSKTEINTEDSGKELTANKRNRVDRLSWDDIKDKDAALRVRETTKNKVYPRPDYQGMVDGGMEPLIAHIVKQAYDSLASKPNTRNAPTDEQLKSYIDGVNRYMEGVLSWVNDKAKVNAFIVKLAGRAKVLQGAVSGMPTSLLDMAREPKASLLETVYPGGWRNNVDEVRLLGGNKALAALQPSTDEAVKAMNEIGKGWPSSQEAWQRRGYRVVSGDDIKASVYLGKRTDGTKYAAISYRIGNGTVNHATVEGAESESDKSVQDEIKAGLDEVKGRYVLLDKGNRTVGAFDTESAAQDKARELTARKGKSTISDKGISVEAAERVGADRRMEGEDINSDQLRETFGFKGVNFGNWMKGKGNEAERQLHLNHAYDSFMDLAELLGVPPKAMSLNGMLGIAIGAQGTGQYAAHFVPGVNEINLTRTSGAGSLAHEFAHAVDHYFARLAGLERKTDPFLTNNVKLSEKSLSPELRPEILAVFKAVVQSMNVRQETEGENKLSRDIGIKRAEKNVNGWLNSIRGDFIREKVDEKVFDALAERIRNLDLGDGMVALSNQTSLHSAIAEMRDLYKAATGRMYSLDRMVGMQANVDHLKYLKSDKAQASEHIPQTETDYSREAAKLDKDKGGKPYWNTPWEKFARAFDAFVSDKLETRAAKNTYLSHAGRSGETVPKGEERTAINTAFDKLIDTLETKETDQGTALREPETEYTATSRSHGIPKEAATIHTFVNDQPLKARTDYKPAKAGDYEAAARLVRGLVKPANLEAARKQFGSEAIYVPAVGMEATGQNQIPRMLAEYYATEAGAKTSVGEIVQVNMAFHTGAGPMERLIARPLFDGPVEKDGKYVLVDDVTTMGGTLAEMANHIQANGGQVVGIVTLVNAGRSATMIPGKQQINEIERRYGHEISALFGIEPAGLTRNEATYILGFRDVEALRNRAAKAERQRSERLRAKGVQEVIPPETGELQEPVSEYSPADDLLKDATEEQKTLAREALADLGRLGVHDRRAKPRLLGSRIPQEFSEKGHISLIGQKIETPEDLAVLAQVYRDPRFETFRIFFTKGGTIVSQTGVTSRLPGMVRSFIGHSTEEAHQYFAVMRDAMKKAGANGFYLLHNHPSGTPSASAADLIVTQTIVRDLSDFDFKGHVILNENRYGQITMDKDNNTISEVKVKPMVSDYSLRRGQPTKAHPLLGQAANSPQRLAHLAKQAQVSPGYIVLIGSSNDGVRGIMEVPMSVLQSRLRALAVVRKFARDTGSKDVFAAGIPDSEIELARQAIKYNVLRDVVYMSGRHGYLDEAVESGYILGKKTNKGLQAEDTPVAYGEPEENRLLRPARKGTMAQDASIFDHLLGGKFLFKAVGRVGQTTGSINLMNRTYDTILQKTGEIMPDAVKTAAEKVKAGIVSDYGLEENYLERKADMRANEAAQARKSHQMIEMLANLSRAESRVAYYWMQEKPDSDVEKSLMAKLPEASRQNLKDLKKLISDMGKDAVRLKQLTADSYERNNMAYLHRSYAKHVLAEEGVIRRMLRSRALRIKGDQYKGRGIFEEIGMERIQNIAPDFWKRKTQAGKADAGLKGEKFIRFEKRDASGEVMEPLPGMTAKPLGRLRGVAYWPASEKVPARYGDWVNAGTWEVRSTKGDNLIMWRDLTKAERERLGELDEVRYAVAQTLQMMVHDIEVGRFFEWVGGKYGKKDAEGKVVEAKEGLRHAYAKGTWVRVPDTEIPGTKVKKYGALSGLYIPGPIWNDMRQIAAARYEPWGRTYANVLRFWKRSKTSWTPGVHMNNVIANFVLADWHDIRSVDLYDALKVWTNRNEDGYKQIFERFQDSGALGGMFVSNELMRNEINERLKELKADLMGESEQAEAGNMAKVLQLVSLAIKPVKATGNSMTKAYQAEDEFFRLAVFLKAIRYGHNDRKAGSMARHSFLDYGINAPWVQAVRHTGLPFISFFYRAFPMLVQTARNKPWKVVKLMAFWSLLSALGYAMTGDDDEDRERKRMPEGKAGRVWGLVPKMIRMPWSYDGQPVFLDIRRWVPVGDIADFELGSGWVPPPLVPSGPLVTLAEVMPFINKSLFTQNEIYKDTDTFGEASTKVMDHLFKSIMPNVPVPNPIGWMVADETGQMQTYAWSGIEKAISRKENQIGEVRSVPQALLNTVGVKVGTYPANNMLAAVQAGLRRNMESIDQDIARVGRNYARLERPSESDKERRDKAIARQIQKKRELVKDARERMGQ